VSPGFGYSTPDFGVLPFGGGLPALRPFLGALQSLALTLLCRTLADVRIQLSVVRRLLADICDSVPLVGDLIPFVGDPLAPREFALAQRDRLLALIEVSSAARGFTWRVGTVLGGDHASP